MEHFDACIAIWEEGRSFPALHETNGIRTVEKHIQEYVGNSFKINNDGKIPYLEQLKNIMSRYVEYSGNSKKIKAYIFPERGYVNLTFPEFISMVSSFMNLRENSTRRFVIGAIKVQVKNKGDDGIELLMSAPDSLDGSEFINFLNR